MCLASCSAVEEQVRPILFVVPHIRPAFLRSAAACASSPDMVCDRGRWEGSPRHNDGGGEVWRTSLWSLALADDAGSLARAAAWATTALTFYCRPLAPAAGHVPELLLMATTQKLLPPMRKNGRRTCTWPRSATRADSSRVKLSKLPLERPEESSQRQNTIRLDRGLDFSATSRPNCKKRISRDGSTLLYQLIIRYCHVHNIIGKALLLLIL